MLTYFKRFITRFLMCLSLLMTTVGCAPIVCLSAATLTVGCTATGALEARFPHARIHRVCAKPKVVGWDANEWVYTPGGMPVSSTAEIFPLVSARAHVVFTFDATAPEGSTRLLTMPDNQINCAAWLHAEIEQWCSLEPASFEKRADPKYVAQSTSEVRSPYLQGVPTAAFAPNCQTLVREGLKQEAQAKGFNYGQQLGFTLGATEGAMNHLLTAGRGIIAEEFKKDPAFLDKLLLGLAQRLERLSQPPEYTDPELAGIAQAAFVNGYGKGVAEIQLQFNAIHTGGNALIVLLPNIIGAVELVGARALRAVLTRMRMLPVFLPSAIGGPGIFLRLPKASPTTSTAPTYIEPRMPAPASITRAPSAPPPRTPPSTNAATNAVGAAATHAAPSGQLHHGISDAVHKALENHDKLKGVYKLRDPRFTARAATPEAHNGYQDWHVALDKEVAKYIRENKDLDPKKFESWLRKRYMKPDLVERFPGGLGENK
jgi:hypothetical protein